MRAARSRLGVAYILPSQADNFAVVHPFRVLNSGNSLRWHKEIFEWLDEWVGHGKKVEEDVSVEAATKQSMVAASPAFIIQREVN